MNILQEFIISATCRDDTGTTVNNMTVDSQSISKQLDVYPPTTLGMWL